MTADIHPITLPKLGLTMEEGSVAAWHVELGAKVKEGDEIVDIETEKVTVAHESPATGTLRRTIASLEESLPVGSLIGILAEDEVSDAEIDSFVANFVPENKPD